MQSADQRVPGSRRVLVVEDDSLVGEVIAAMLDGHHDAVVVESVAKALAHLAVEGIDKPEVILLDCLLPGGGLNHLLGAADQQSISIVLISGDPERAALIGGKRRFLPKPFSQDRLLQVLRAVFN